MSSPLRPAQRQKTTRGPLLEAVKVGCRDLGGRRGDVAYCVIETRTNGDKRSTPRRRTRLRSGKILDPRNAFLIECQIYDRSENGARLRLVANIPMPGKIRLYEDAPERLTDAFVVWRKNGEVGICFASCVHSRKITPAQLACLRGRYYAAGG
jgi:hypothetical protein